MSEVEKLNAFISHMRNLFNKHLNVFTSANSRLEVSDYEGFEKQYESQTKEELVEMVMAQHISYNQLYSEYDKKAKQVLQIMKEISYARTAEDFELLRKKADMTLMAQNLADKGKSPDEIKKIIEGETSTVFHNEQNVITGVN